MKRGSNEPRRVVIDTNIWISFLIGKRLAGLHRHIDSGRVEVVTCEGDKNIRRGLRGFHGLSFMVLLLTISVLFA